MGPLLDYWQTASRSLVYLVKVTGQMPCLTTASMPKAVQFLHPAWGIPNGSHGSDIATTTSRSFSWLRASLECQYEMLLAWEAVGSDQKGIQGARGRIQTQRSNKASHTGVSLGEKSISSRGARRDIAFCTSASDLVGNLVASSKHSRSPNEASRRNAFWKSLFRRTGCFRPKARQKTSVVMFGSWAPSTSLWWLSVFLMLPTSVEGMLMLPMQALSTSLTIIIVLVIFLFVVPVICKIIHILRVQVNKIRNADIWGDQNEVADDDEDDEEY